MVDRAAVRPGTRRGVPMGNAGKGLVTSEGLFVWSGG